jgi:hypothetical protein
MGIYSGGVRGARAVAWLGDEARTWDGWIISAKREIRIGCVLCSSI